MKLTATVKVTFRNLLVNVRFYHLLGIYSNINMYTKFKIPYIVFYTILILKVKD